MDSISTPDASFESCVNTAPGCPYMVLPVASCCFTRQSKVRPRHGANYFMVITLSCCSGHKTSERNGSAGSPKYGFMKYEGLGDVEGTEVEELIACFHLDKQVAAMNNVTGIIQGDSILTNNNGGGLTRASPLEIRHADDHRHGDGTRCVRRPLETIYKK